MLLLSQNNNCFSKISDNLLVLVDKVSLVNRSIFLLFGICMHAWLKFSS